MYSPGRPSSCNKRISSIGDGLMFCFGVIKSCAEGNKLTIEDEVVSAATISPCIVSCAG